MHYAVAPRASHMKFLYETGNISNGGQFKQATLSNMRFSIIAASKFCEFGICYNVN